MRDAGSDPVNSLSCINAVTSCGALFPNVDVMVPVKLLLWSMRICSDGAAKGNASGAPMNLLLLSLKSCMLGVFRRKFGISPLSWLLLKYGNTKFVMFLKHLELCR